MPYDSNGVWSLTAGYLGVTGQTILPSNHNPPLEDIRDNGLSAVLVRDGRAPMTGPLNMGTTNKIVNLANGTVNTDGVNKGQMDAAITAAIPSPLTFQGHLYGLTLSNNATDPTNDIDISTGAAASDAATPVLMSLASTLTKRLDAAWAVGSGNGGLDTGSIANTTYNIWLIQRSDTGVVDALFSASATAPTMPTNYDRKRLIGSLPREAGALVGITQVGDVFKRKLPVRDVSAASSGTSAVTRTLSIPTGRALEALLTIQVATSAAGGETVYISELSSTDQAASSPYITVGLAGGAGGQEWVYGRWFTNTSAQIRSRQSVGGATETLNIYTTGWVDTRGRLG